MASEIPRALGAIAQFCDLLAVDTIRLIQCDSEIKSDAILSPDELAVYQVSGFGGSNLSPAMRAFADDPRVSAAVIVTDGDIEYPAEDMPYGVLWVLPVRGNFAPRYGMVISMEGDVQ
jgi:predicted metal-dependent peptidase